MEYQALTGSDLANIAALNEEYLLIQSRRPGAGETAKAIAALRPAQRSWLARTPLLLFSIRERDLERWAQLDDVIRNPDLFVRQCGIERQLAQVAAAAAAFAWQLAHRNPYPLRLLFDASSDWIALIAAARFLDVVKFAQASPSLLALREIDDPAFWPRLLGAGVSRERDVRRAARLSALQSMYARPRNGERGGSWPAAACAVPKPRLRVADTAGAGRRRRDRQSE